VEEEQELFFEINIWIATADLEVKDAAK